VRFDEDEAFKKRAYEAVVKLQNYDDNHIKAWNLICAHNVVLPEW
jgi:arginyl-tRNA synthetase